MAKNKVIIIDIDETILPTGKHWLKYLMSHYSLKMPLLELDVLPYNLSSLFDLKGDYSLEYFENAFLYDGLKPYDEALESIHKMKVEGCDIIFVSAISGGVHAASKQRFINKYFPDYPIIFTKDKKYVKADVFIDDSFHQVNVYKEYNPESVVIKYRMDYTEGLELNDGIIIKYNWKDIYSLIRGLYE